MNAMWWWTTGLCATAAALTASAVRDTYRVPWMGEGIAGRCIMIGLCAVAIAAIWMGHFAVDDQPDPAGPSRQCVTQQLEKVWVGKSYAHEWVCTGWSQ